jgi:hypothetical protein
MAILGKLLGLLASRAGKRARDLLPEPYRLGDKGVWKELWAVVG